MKLRILLATIAFALSGPAWAEPVQRHSVTPSDWLQMFIGLAFVLLMIGFIAWILRRVSGPVSMGSGHLRIVSVLPVGTRERIALIQAGKDQVLVGITPSGISRIHTLSEPVEVNEPVQPEFARRLQAMLKRSETHEG